MEKLGRFVCHLFDLNVDISDIEDWEKDLTSSQTDFSSDFKRYTKWFINGTTVDKVSYKNYMEDGASFVEQCFAIWANVVELDDNKVLNYQHSINRVEQYIKSYYIEGYKDDLEEWECYLH